MSKKIVLGIIISTAAVNAAGFLYYLFAVMSFFRNPLDFNVLTIFLLVLMLVGLFVHLMLYVHFMDLKVKKFTIEDEDEWWHKWDYDFRK